MKKSQLFNIACLVLIMPLLIGCLAKNNPEPDPVTSLEGYWDNGEIIALFHDIEGHKHDLVSSYMHIGQHGEANYQLVLSKTVPASEVEYSELHDELVVIGYDLVVVTGCCPVCDVGIIGKDSYCDDCWSDYLGQHQGSRCPCCED